MHPQPVSGDVYLIKSLENGKKIGGKIRGYTGRRVTEGKEDGGEWREGMGLWVGG